MTLFDSNHKLPKAEAGDHVVAAVKAVIDLIPGAEKLFEYIFTPPLARRREDWWNELAADVRLLQEQRGITLEDLVAKPKFIDAVTSATHAALRTSSREKLRALRNVVLNAGLPGSPDVTVQQIFLAVTDRFSDLHLRLLRFAQEANHFKTPDGRPLTPRPNAADVLVQAFPDATVHESLYKLVWTDLYAAGFLALPNLDNGYEGDATQIKRTSDFGDQYLAFIRSPLSDER